MFFLVILIGFAPRIALSISLKFLEFIFSKKWKQSIEIYYYFYRMLICNEMSKMIEVHCHFKISIFLESKIYNYSIIILLECTNIYSSINIFNMIWMSWYSKNRKAIIHCRLLAAYWEEHRKPSSFRAENTKSWTSSFWRTTLRQRSQYAQTASPARPRRKTASVCCLTGTVAFVDFDRSLRLRTGNWTVSAIEIRPSATGKTPCTRPRCFQPIGGVRSHLILCFRTFPYQLRREDSESQSVCRRWIAETGVRKLS